MKINKAVITAAGPNQRHLPLQTLVDTDGVRKPALRIILEEILSAGIEETAVVIAPGDRAVYAEAAGDLSGRVRFIVQGRPSGYGNALWCARAFTGREAFLHLVSDHLWISLGPDRCARQLVEAARIAACSVSAVQVTREHLLPYFGIVAARRLKNRHDLYEVRGVAEKPTPTEAERRLVVPGLRAGYYLGFFGMHVLTPAVMAILGGSAGHGRAGLSAALDQLAGQEKYLALEVRGQRFNLGVKYGLLTAQLALGLSGRDRDEILTQLVELLSNRELSRAK
jgi:UTP--glucose-1-phosphate uridylyltransferase